MSQQSEHHEATEDEFVSIEGLSQHPPAEVPGSDGGPGDRPRSGSLSDPPSVLILIGICSVVVGGLVAAVTGPFDLVHGSWLAAYLVLVVGMTQWAMGHARTKRSEGAQTYKWGWAQIAGWNLGSALVIGGTLAGEPAVVSVGSALLVASLAIAIHATRRSIDPGAHPAVGWTPRWVDWVYRILLLVLAVSIPVGMVLSYVRHS